MLTISVAPSTPIDTLGKAFALLPADETETVCIHLAPGTYREKLTLHRSHTMIEGSGVEQTKVVFGDAATEVMEDGMKRGTFRTATLMIDAPYVTLRHLTIENDAAPREEAGQAIALYVDGDHFQAEHCALLGHQDTLFTAPLPLKELQKNGFVGPKQFAPRTPQRQVYRDCLIAGDIDFIFGSAAAWFDHCEIRSVDGRKLRSTPYESYISAPSTPAGQRYGYVFYHCRLTGDNIPDGSVYLGRPWRNDAKAVYISCEMGSHIQPSGFHDWNKPDAHATMFFAEYGSLGKGAEGVRADYVHQLTEAEANTYTLEQFEQHALDV